MYGIPNMKLEKEKVERRGRSDARRRRDICDQLRVGKDILADRLRKDNDALVLCGGATNPRDLPIAGRELGGVHFAMEFLHGNMKQVLDDKHGSVPGEGFSYPFISAKDRDVIVIGGGDTGNDCLGTSMRHGCRSVNMFEILPKPPPGQGHGQPVAGVATYFPCGLWPCRSGSALRRGSAHVSDKHQEIRGVTNTGN